MSGLNCPAHSPPPFQISINSLHHHFTSTLSPRLSAYAQVAHADSSLVRSHGDVHRDPKSVPDALLIGHPVFGLHLAGSPLTRARQAGCPPLSLSAPALPL